MFRKKKSKEVEFYAIFRLSFFLRLIQKRNPAVLPFFRISQAGCAFLGWNVGGTKTSQCLRSICVKGTFPLRCYPVLQKFFNTQFSSYILVQNLFIICPDGFVYHDTLPASYLIKVQQGLQNFCYEHVHCFVRLTIALFHSIMHLFLKIFVWIGLAFSARFKVISIHWHGHAEVGGDSPSIRHSGCGNTFYYKSRRHLSIHGTSAFFV